MPFTTLRTYEIEPLMGLQEIRLRGIEVLQTNGVVAVLKLRAEVDALRATLEGVEILFHGPTLLSQLVLQVTTECAPRLYVQHPSGLRYPIHETSGSVAKFVLNTLEDEPSFVYWAKLSAGCRLFLSAANGSSGIFDLSMVVEPISG